MELAKNVLKYIAKAIIAYEENNDKNNNKFISSTNSERKCLLYDSKCNNSDDETSNYYSNEELIDSLDIAIEELHNTLKSNRSFRTNLSNGITSDLYTKRINRLCKKHNIQSELDKQILLNEIAYLVKSIDRYYMRAINDEYMQDTYELILDQICKEYSQKLKSGVRLQLFIEDFNKQCIQKHIKVLHHDDLDKLIRFRNKNISITYRSVDDVEHGVVAYIGIKG